MSPHDLALWIKLYAAMGLCCGIAAGLSILRILVLYRQDARLRPQGVKGWMLAGPLAWWRWQKTYLTTAPVTLGIIALYAASLPWEQSPTASQTHAGPSGDLATSNPRS